MSKKHQPSSEQSINGKNFQTDQYAASMYENSDTKGRKQVFKNRHSARTIRSWKQ